MDNELCSMKTCDVCQNNKFATNLENGPLIDLRLLRKSNAKINEKQKCGKYSINNGNLNLLGWIVLKSDIVVRDKYDIALAELNIIDSVDYW